jgi:hypothetical protein
MSTIQTQLSLVHLQSGLNTGAAWQRTSEESSFSANAITVTTTPEALDLGDITIPRQVLLKLAAGPDILVSLDGGSTYQMSLHGVNDSLLIALESRSIWSLTCSDDAPANSLDGEYFDAHDASGPVRVWISTSGGSATAPATPDGGRLIRVDIDSGDSEEVVAPKIADALNTDGAFHSSASAFDVLIADVAPGSRPIFTTGTSPFFLTNQSTSVPDVYFQSFGSSQLVVGVAPA